jgi:hypothetical protein
MPPVATGRNPARFWLDLPSAQIAAFATGCHRLRPLCTIDARCLGVRSDYECIYVTRGLSLSLSTTGRRCSVVIRGHIVDQDVKPLAFVF